jgi:transcriptional regulator with XRE-family HTH domain
MAAHNDDVGSRIADQRKVAGLTQRGLADRINYSYSLIHQVESGHKTASPDLVSAVARALHIDVTVLTGQPYMAELEHDRLAGLIRPIREALDLYDLGGDPPGTLRDVGELANEADRLCRLVRASQIKVAAEALPAVITELTTAASGDGSPSSLWGSLASTYRTAHDVCVKLGYYDLATVALDRMEWAACKASDPLLSAIRQYMRALVYFREGENSVGLRLIERGHGVVAAAEPTMAARAVTGQLHLGASILAAGSRDADAAAAHLGEAAVYAQELGEVGDIHWLSFGPTNVVCHEVSVGIELGRYGEAWEKAELVRLPDDWAPSRRAHFHLDRARTQLETGHLDDTLNSVLTARREAPQQTRYHPSARGLIKDLIRRRRTTPHTLDSLAVWVGM